MCTSPESSPFPSEEELPRIVSFDSSLRIGRGAFWSRAIPQIAYEYSNKERWINWLTLDYCVSVNQDTRALDRKS
jgi:hypothetical protein